MAIKRYIGRTSVTPAPLTNTAGIMRSARTATEGLLGGISVLRRASDLAYGEGVLQRTQEAQEAAAVTNIMRDSNGQYVLPENMGGDFTIYDKAFQKAMLSKYAATLQTDITSSLQKFSQDNLFDPQGFETSASSYVRETIEQVDPRVRDQVLAYANNQKVQFAQAIGNRTAMLVRDNAIAANNVATKQAIGTALSAVQMVEPGGDLWSNREVSNSYAIAVGNIADQEQWIGKEQVELKISQLNRRIEVQHATGVFNKYSPMERAAAIESLRSRKGDFFNKHPAFQNMGEAELTNITSIFNQLNTSMNTVADETGKTIADDFAVNFIDQRYYSPRLSAVIDAWNNNPVGRATNMLAILQKQQAGITKQEKAIIHQKNLEQVIQKFPEYKKFIDQLPEEMQQNPDLMSNQVQMLLSSIRMDNYITNKQWTDKRRVDALAAKADSEKLYKEAISEHLAHIKEYYPEISETVKMRLENVNDPGYLTTNKAKLTFLVNALKTEAQRSSYQSITNQMRQVVPNILRIAEQLGTDAQATLDQIMKGDVNPADALTLLKQTETRYVTQLKAMQKNTQEEVGAINALDKNIPMGGYRKKGEISSRVGRRMIQNYNEENNTNLDPNDVRSWMQLNLLPMGIPDEFIQIMRGAYDYENSAKVQLAVDHFKTLRNNPMGAAHLEGQLGAKLYGQLSKISELSLDQAGTRLETIKAIMANTTLPSEENYKLLPNEMAFATNGQRRQQTFVLKDFRGVIETVNERIAEGDAAGLSNFFGRLLPILSASPKELASGRLSDAKSYAPASDEFVKEAYTRTLEVLHHYQGNRDADEALQAATSAVIKTMLSAGGPNGWGWSRFLGRQPGITRNEQYVLTKNPIERNFSAPSPEDPSGLKWIDAEIVKQIKNNKHPDYDLTPRFGQRDGNVYLKPTSKLNADGQPLYSVGMYDAEGDMVFGWEMRNKQGGMLLINLGPEYERRRAAGLSSFSQKVLNDRYEAHARDRAIKESERKRAQRLEGNVKYKEGRFDGEGYP